MPKKCNLDCLTCTQMVHVLTAVLTHQAVDLYETVSKLSSV